MFSKLKNKLKEWSKKVSEIDEEVEEIKEETEQVPGKKTEKKKNSKKEQKNKSLSSEQEKENSVQKKKEKKKDPEQKTPKETIEEKSNFITKVEGKELEKEAKEEKKGFFKKMFSKKESEEEPKNEKKLPTDDKLKEEAKKEKYIEPEKKFNIALQKYEPVTNQIEKTLEKEDESKEEKKHIKKSSFFSKKKTIAEEEFEDYSEDLEMILLENNVALEVVDKILEELKDKIVGHEMNKKEIEKTIESSLKQIIENVLIEPFNIIQEIKEKKEPYVMIFCGINGVGKTTQIAKFAHMLKEKGLTCVMAAGDTFRAAAVEQIKEHGNNLDIKVISHDYGSDPAAVGFDAIKYAKKNKIDVVLIDTAGRIHTATNLLKEMEKIKRVCKPDRTIFVGESITGNDAVDQVKAFNDNIGIDGIFLSKADIDEKGGTALSVGYITKKPIIYLGTGQNYEDIEPFNKEAFIKKLELDEE